MLDLGADKVQIVYGLCRLHVGWLSERRQWFSRLVPCAQVRQVGQQADKPQYASWKSRQYFYLQVMGLSRLRRGNQRGHLTTTGTVLGSRDVRPGGRAI